MAARRTKPARAAAAPLGSGTTVGVTPLEAAAKASADAIIVAGLDGKVLEWNASAERLFGLATLNRSGMVLADLLLQDAPDMAERAQLIRCALVKPFEHVRGRSKELLISAAPLIDASGQPHAYAATVRDITQQKRAMRATIERLNAECARRARAEGALRESQSRLNVVFQTAAEGIISVDEHGIVDSFNSAAERIFGYDADEVMGRSISMLMPEPFASKHAGYIAEFMRSHEAKVIGVGREVSGRRKDGTLFPMDLAVGEGVDGDGPIFTGIVRDLTARKEVEYRMRASERMAAIGTLAAGLGHDMNNVLLPVRARLDAMAAGKSRESDARHLDEVRSSIAYLQQLADGLHFLAMDPERSDSLERVVSTDVREWWRQAGVLLAKAVPKRVRVSSMFPAGLPRVPLAPHELSQAVLNLVVNAGEALGADPLRKRHQGHVHVWARVQRDSSGQRVLIGVTDNGCGMTDEVRRRATDIFFTTKPRGKGTGLGLALVRKVTERVGGRVEIASQIRKGTTVVLSIPALSSVSAERALNPRIRVGVLVADGRVATVINHVLEGAGAEVLGNGRLGEACILVTDPTAALLKHAEAWRKERRGGTLIVLGSPKARSLQRWKKERVFIIKSRDDLAEIRETVGAAIAAAR